MRTIFFISLLLAANLLLMLGQSEAELALQADTPLVISQVEKN
jgi:hypothetical protein